MKIVIAGAGEVGFYLARLLSNESQDIVLIDNDTRVLDKAQNELDIFTIKGDAVSISVLTEAGVQDADLLIAVTSSETTNFTLATIGKQLGAKRTIARVNNLEFLGSRNKIDFQKIGIDVMISPEELAAKEISRLIRRSAFTDTFEFEFGKLILLGVHLDKMVPVVGKTIRETAYLNPDLDFITVAIQRKNGTLVPRSDSRFELGDHVYFIALPSGIEKVLELTGKEAHRIRKVMILGGGKVGENTALKIRKRRKVKLIEKDPIRSFQLADELNDVLIINDDGHNVSTLVEENIDEMDAFVAVTGNSETNIMSCLVAKAQGVKKTIALVENIDYINLSQTIGIDTLINKKLIAANNIFRYVRQGDIISIAGLHGVNAEILEFVVSEEALVTQSPIREVHFPKGAIVGGLVREGKGKIVTGDDRIEAGDRVVVFCETEKIKDVERLF